MALEDSGAREEYGTGAVRDIQEGKGRYDLIPHGPLRRLAIHYEAGAKKYDERNWEKGIPTSRCFSSAVRHLYRWLDGSRSEDHLAAAVWNIFAIMYNKEKLPNMMDTPGNGAAPQERGFFTNKFCKYYPCHQGLDTINCLFCYCPLYPYDDCGGHYTYTKGRKDCSRCLLPHQQSGFEYVMNFLETKGANK